MLRSKIQGFPTKFALTIVLVAGLLSGGNILAQPMLPNLPAGTQYRLAFVTSTQSEAGDSNISFYNNFVQSVANTQPLLAPMSWTAIASTSAVAAINNTSTNGAGGVPIYLVDGSTKIADDYPDLWDGLLPHDLDITEMGTQFTSPIQIDVWTGTEVTGVRRLGEELGSPTPRIGKWNMSSSDWISNSNDTSSRSHSLYAISNVLTATSVPEPTSFLCLGLVGVGCAWWRKYGMRVGVDQD